MPQSYSHPLNYLRVLRRRKWWFAIPALLCIAGGIAAARLWPPTYKTVATVAVQAPTVTPDLVAQRAALNTEERLRALTQQLRSPLVLERVVREEALATDRPVDAVVAGASYPHHHRADETDHPNGGCRHPERL